MSSKVKIHSPNKTKIENKQVFNFPASKSNVVNTQTVNAEVDVSTVNNEQIFKAQMKEISVKNSQVINCPISNANITNTQIIGPESARKYDTDEVLDLSMKVPIKKHHQQASITLMK